MREEKAKGFGIKFSTGEKSKTWTVKCDKTQKTKTHKN